MGLSWFICSSATAGHYVCIEGPVGARLWKNRAERPYGCFHELGALRWVPLSKEPSFFGSILVPMIVGTSHIV